MRTTLTLDDDVAVMIRKLERTQHRAFKEIVNAALREGLAQLARPPARVAKFSTKPLNLGACKVGNVDDVSELLDVVEGDAHR